MKAEVGCAGSQSGSLLMVITEAQNLRNGVYTPRFMTQSFKNCEKAYKNIKSTAQSFFGAAGYNMASCPLPAGTYNVKDWVVDLKLNNIPTFMYGSYKLVITFTREEKRVGCLNIYADVIPKDTGP